MAAHDDVLRRLRSLLSSGALDRRPRLVNLHGPLGVGKSRSLARPPFPVLTPTETWPVTDRLVVDGVDHEAHVAAVLTHLRRFPALAGACRCSPVLAGIGGADEELLNDLVTLPPDGFDRIGALSVVSPRLRGLTVAEPYRTVLDLAHRWRQLAAHRRAAGRGTRHRFAQIQATADPQLRAELADQVVFLSRKQWLRDRFSAEPEPPLRIRPAQGAEEDVTRLVDRWARTEGLDRRRAARMLRLWLDGGGSGWHSTPMAGRSA